MCVSTHHVCNNYVTYTAAMRPYFRRLQQFRQRLCTTRRVRSFRWKLRSRGNVDGRHKDDHERKHQKRTATHDAYREWLHGELSSGLEHSKVQRVFRHEISAYTTCLLITIDHNHSLTTKLSSSLVPRLSPRTTTTTVKEGESLVPFRT